MYIHKKNIEGYKHTSILTKKLFMIQCFFKKKLYLLLLLFLITHALGRFQQSFAVNLRILD